MNEKSSKVVSFQQNAAFFSRRAIKKRMSGHYQEAVTLLQRALTNAPDHAGYLMELAELYSEMGCPVESNRCLIRLLAGDSPDPLCHFGMACNLFSMGNVTGAQIAALNYLDNDPQGHFHDQATDMLTAIQYTEQIHRPQERQLLRCYRLNERAAAMLNADQAHTACQLLEKSMALHDDFQTHALYAFALSECGRMDEAALEANSVLWRKGISTECVLYALRALTAAGRIDQAYPLAEKLRSKKLEPYEARRLLEVFLLLKSDRSVQDLLSAALKLSPFDRILLHAQAAVFYNEGRVDDALTWWRHMLEIDPNDIIALTYVEYITGGKPPARPIPMQPKLTEDMARDMRALIQAGDWSDFAALLRACMWSLLSGDLASSLQAARLLERNPDHACEMALRYTLAEPVVLYAAKAVARDALAARGARLPYITVGRDTLAPDLGDEPKEERCPALNHVLKSCVKAALALDVELTEPFLKIWGAVIPHVLSARDNQIYGYGVAIFARAAAQHGLSDAKSETCRALHCSMRLIDRYTKKLEKLLGEGD